jgi:GNAT superfamily N-acetyltransferase
MPLPEGLALREADLADVPALLALRREVGWAAHEWALRLAIEPDNARCVVVDDGGDGIVGVGSGVAYGPIGFVGNMIVAASHRRQGLGSAILESVIAFLAASGASRLELYATEDGRPLYARYGFTFIEPGSRVVLPGPATLEPPREISVSTAANTDVGELLAYDAPRFGGPRRALLQTMARDPERPLLVARRGGGVVGFGWLRVDDARIGPWVADDADVATSILATALEVVAGAELTANVPMSNRTALRWLATHGVTPDPWDGRMARGASVERREDTIYGNTVGALG